MGTHLNTQQGLLRQGEPTALFPANGTSAATVPGLQGTYDCPRFANDNSALTLLHESLIIERENRREREKGRQLAAQGHSFGQDQRVQVVY